MTERCNHRTNGLGPFKDCAYCVATLGRNEQQTLEAWLRTGRFGAPWLQPGEAKINMVVEFDIYPDDEDAVQD